MNKISPQYIVNEKGEKTSVLLSIKDFNRIMKELDDFDDIRLYDNAKSETDDYIEASVAFDIIDKSRAI